MAQVHIKVKAEWFSEQKGKGRNDGGFKSDVLIGIGLLQHHKCLISFAVSIGRDFTCALDYDSEWIFAFSDIYLKRD